ncbi:hypothetical protein [Virgibacillus kimchii]
MNIAIFLGSLLGLQFVSALIYTGILFLIIWVTGKCLNRDGTKWSRIFNFGKGTGLYVFVITPYIIAMIALFFISRVWFDFISFPNIIISSIFVVIFCALIAIYPFSKLKDSIIKNA